MAAQKKDQVQRKENPRHVRRQKEKEEFDAIETKLKDLKLFSGSKYFDDLPLTQKTKDGLQKANFTQLTEIQRKAVPLALAKRDVLGAAKTGSGKTLAFLIPVLERLYRQQWNMSDGLGAVIISPTRELAVQIFEVLRKIGRLHTLSAGLIIGGKDKQIEQERISRMNILVCTPGRLLQHMDQTVGFNCDNLQMLVLDEADRLMDMGFQRTINAIIENLPKERQTLLFSATQSRSVKDLVRLSLKDPEYVAVHEQAEHSTPQKLSQHYLVCDLPDKLDIMYSFIRTHLKSKVIVFLSCCKQARFVFECFCKLQPGIPLMALHGKQKQTKRVDIFRKFGQAEHAVLFCTDIAARGLDFPAVDWVVQLDCPDDAATYIHRAGRTARFEADGHALLMLLPTEKDGMLQELANKKVPIDEIKIRANKQQTIQTKLQSFCFQDPEIKYLGQRAFVAYLRSIYLQRNKSIFNVQEMPAEAYAHSLGLAGTPKIKFIKKSEKTKADAALAEDEQVKTKTVKTKHDRMIERRNQGILSEHYNKMVDYDNDKLGGVANDDDDEDFMTIGRVDHALESDSDDNMDDTKADNLSKRKTKMGKKELAKRSSKGEKLVFDEEGNPHQLYEMIDEAEFLKAGDAKAQKDAFIAEHDEMMKQADVEDKAVAKKKRDEKKLKRKMREQERDLGSEDEDEMEMSSEEESSASSAADSSDQDSEEEQEEKKPHKRKWFQTDDEQDKRKKRVLQVDTPDTLEDQEALALRLLAGGR
ncbi:DEAD-domain-containing protein [Hesseltinella vesiculosa]|uniref:ATP-dependent RNA helicase n=1 Tax=Hesseltinella vesiculosa TaxID=101127 RepID=A0A1X2G8F0_9FUNG|nr:DEAD-domain-containing protein [Hesseltinella vesiculosa]